jgi:LmbE family N-acetylglucosaminyl deacetylase
MGPLLPLVFALATAGAPSPEPIEVSHAERLVVVAPHPDDETLGAGGLMQRVLATGGSVRVVLVTAGDGYVEAVVHETGQPRPAPAEYVAYGERRLAEVREALRVLGRGRIRLQLLGFPDGGLEGLLRAHWQRTHAEHSPTTGASDPPYTQALDLNVAYDGADLRRELSRLLTEARPTIVVLPDPLDRHPDHHASGVLTRLALDDATSGAHAAVPLPRLLSYLVHRPNWPPGWDAPAAAPERSADVLTLPPDLAPDSPRATFELTDAEIAAKRAALARYATQQEVVPTFLAAFVRRTEPFRVLSRRDIGRVVK